MLNYLINIHLPVLIYFIISCIILSIRVFFNNNKKKLIKFLIITILAVIFLEFMYQKNFKKFVWFTCLSPILAFILFILVVGYMILFWKKNKNQKIKDRIAYIKSIFNVINQIRENNSISILNQVRTLIHF